MPYTATTQNGLTVYRGSASGGQTTPASTTTATSLVNGFTDGWSGEVNSPAIQSYTIMLSAPGNCYITSLSVKLGAGTATANVTIGGSAATGLTSIPITTAKSVITLTTPVSVSTGAAVLLNLTAASSDAARLSFSTTYFRSTASVLAENLIGDPTAVLLVNRNNIITYAGAGVYTFPTMEDGWMLELTARTPYAHVISSGTRTFLKAGGITNSTTSTMTASEAGAGRVFRAISGNLIQMSLGIV